MSSITVTRKFEFSYAHHLPEYQGDCANHHGHNSNVEVEFGQSSNLPEAYTGMVIDFKDISKHVQPVIDELDHKDLNEVFGPGYTPTAEHIAKWIAAEILITPIGSGLIRVQVSETDNSFATWRR